MSLMFREDTEHTVINTEKELAYVLYMKFTETMQKIDKVFGCFCLRCSSSNKFDYSKLNEGEDMVLEVCESFCI